MSTETPKVAATLVTALEHDEPSSIGTVMSSRHLPRSLARLGVALRLELLIDSNTIIVSALHAALSLRFDAQVPVAAAVLGARVLGLDA
jgi:hypothetical protein